VSKTISLPLDLLNAIDEESDIMGKDFSSATQVLIRIGLAIRKQQANEPSEEELAILGASKKV